jgi:hypothetical protein
MLGWTEANHEISVLCPGQDSNWSSPGHKLEGIPLEPTIWVIAYCEIRSNLVMFWQTGCNFISHTYILT